MKIKFIGRGFKSEELGISCRIYSKFECKDGLVFLEISGSKKHKYMPKRTKDLPFDNIITSAKFVIEGVCKSIDKDLPYTPLGILQLVNKNFSTEFSEIEIGGETFEYQ